MIVETSIYSTVRSAVKLLDERVLGMRGPSGRARSIGDPFLKAKIPTLPSPPITNVPDFGQRLGGLSMYVYIYIKDWLQCERKLIHLPASAQPILVPEPGLKQVRIFSFVRSSEALKTIAV